MFILKKGTFFVAKSAAQGEKARCNISDPICPEKCGSPANDLHLARLVPLSSFKHHLHPRNHLSNNILILFMDDDDVDYDSDVKMWLVLGGRQVPQLTSISAGTISISRITITTIIIITHVDLTGGKSTRASHFCRLCPAQKNRSGEIISMFTNGSRDEEPSACSELISPGPPSRTSTELLSLLPCWRIKMWMASMFVILS